MAVSWSNITFNSIDLVSEKVTQIADSIHQPDGIVAIDKEAYFISSWKGTIHHVTKKDEKTVLLDTSKEKFFSADIDYMISCTTLLL